MAISEVYVDPSINADSGAGTSGDPYGDLEYAIEQETFNTTDGTRLNIKSGSTETLAAKLNTAFADTSVSVAWVTSASAPCIFQGYTSAAEDGGKGTIDGGAGDFSIIDTSGTASHIHFIDLNLQNTGTAKILNTGTYCGAWRCSFSLGTNAELVDFNNNSTVVGCDFLLDTVPQTALSVGSPAYISHNYVESNETGNQTGIVHTASGQAVITNNIVWFGPNVTNGNGITIRDMGICVNNSLYNDGASTGNGINGSSATNRAGQIIANNLIEGWSGTGGTAITSDEVWINVVNNSYYDCTDGIEIASGGQMINLGWGSATDSNEALGASPFTDAANKDFSPVDTGAVKEGSEPDDFGNGAV